MECVNRDTLSFCGIFCLSKVPNSPLCLTTNTIADSKPASSVSFPGHIPSVKAARTFWLRLASDIKLGSEATTTLGRPGDEANRRRGCCYSRLMVTVNFLPSQFCTLRLGDWILLTIGSVMAAIHGAALPVAMLVFGELTNDFVNQYASTQLANYVYYFELEDLFGRDEFFIIAPDILASGVINFKNITGGVVNCSEDYVLIRPSLNFDESLQIGITELAECLENDEFIDKVNYYIQLFAGLALIAFIASFIQIVSYQVSAERRMFVLKKQFYRALLRQNIGWFDAHPTGELSNRLSE